MQTAAKTAFIMAILTLGSKFIGFIREMFLANFFGASYIVDAYVVSVSIPGMIFAGILGAVSTSFIPIFSKKYEEEGELQGNLFTSQVINLLIVISIISSIVGIVFSDQIVWIFANGFEGATAELASFYVKITFSYTLFTATSGILESYLKYKNIFLSPIIAGYSISLFGIAFIILSSYTNPYLLVFGIFVGNIVRAVIIWIIAYAKKYKHRFDLHITDTVKQIIALALPVFLGSTVSQINIFVDKALATRLPEGSVAAINYSNLLIGMITGISTTIIATILYPKMAQAFSQKNYNRLSNLYNSGVSILLIIGIPFSLGAMAFGELVIQIVYERGAFDPTATKMTTIAFFFYAVGLVFMALQPFLIQTFYSMHNTKTPLLIATSGLIINIVANLILVNYLAHGGLALGTSIACATNTITLVYCIHKKTRIKTTSATGKKALKVLFASVISVGIAYGFNVLVLSNIWMPRMIQLAIIVVIAAIIYFIILKLFKIKELMHIKEIFKITSKNEE